MGLWTKKTIEQLNYDIEAAPHKLKRTLGPLQLLLLGVGAIIGAGLFSITGIAAAENAGPAIILSFFLAAIGCAFSGLCYSEIASMIPVAGSAYTYAYTTMGELAAWVIGWTLILEYAIGAATVSISWAGYVISFLHDIGIHLPTALIASPWQTVRLSDGSTANGLFNLPAVLIVIAITMLLIRGIKQSATFNSIVVFLKVAVVLVFIGLGAFYINPENYHPFIPENTGTFGEFGLSGVLQAAGIVFFAYIGFDAVSTAAQEAINPQKSLPIGILGSLIVCTFLYVLFALVMIGLVSYKDLNVSAPVAVAIDQTPYWWLNGIVKLAIIIGVSSVILVMLLAQSRIFYAMSRDGFLPPLFSSIHPTFQTPWKSNLILMAFVGCVAAFAPITLVGSLTSMGTLLSFVIVCAGVLILRYKEPGMYRPFKTPWSPFVPVMGILVCLLLMSGLGLDNWIQLVIWLAIGLSIYFAYGRYHVRYSKVEPSKH
jgi:APA family basic amino acid/polyamine antiporter